MYLLTQCIYKTRWAQPGSFYCHLESPFYIFLMYWPLYHCIMAFFCLVILFGLKSVLSDIRLYLSSFVWNILSCHYEPKSLEIEWMSCRRGIVGSLFFPPIQLLWAFWLYLPIYLPLGWLFCKNLLPCDLSPGYFVSISLILLSTFVSWWLVHGDLFNLPF